MTYELGEVAQLQFAAYDTNNSPANATTCTLTVNRPDGTTDTFTPAGAGGVYTVNYLTQVAGLHSYRWLATGTPGPGVGVGAATDVFDVRQSAAANIFSLADARNLLNLPAGVTSYDKKISQYIRSVTGFVEKYCGSVVVRQVTERQRAGGMFIMLNKPPVYQPSTQTYPIISMTPVLTYGLVYDLSLLSVNTVNGEVRHKAGLPFIYGPYDFTYTVGRPVIPEEILTGSEIILKHLWEVERGGSGRTGGYGADDTTIMWGFAIPNRALEVLEPQRTWGGIA